MNLEESPERLKACPISLDQRSQSMNVQYFKNLVGPKNDKEAEATRAKDKANENQKMDDHAIPLEELCYRFGTSLDNGKSRLI